MANNPHLAPHELISSPVNAFANKYLADTPWRTHRKLQRGVRRREDGKLTFAERRSESGIAVVAEGDLRFHATSCQCVFWTPANGELEMDLDLKVLINVPLPLSQSESLAHSVYYTCGKDIVAMVLEVTAFMNCLPAHKNATSIVQTFSINYLYSIELSSRLPFSFCSRKSWLLYLEACGDHYCIPLLYSST
jgi:hypothetical protein